MAVRSIREEAVRLLRRGVANAEVARRLGVPQGTVAWWKHRDLGKHSKLPGRKRSTCAQCFGDQLNRPAYAYLLGLYLGDGHILMPDDTSTDIIALFTATLDAVGVQWKASIPRPTGQANISIARKDSVALMDAHIGPKH
ncbi:helix-turn-helix domain-containing protein [Streptomyces sp. CBMA123]|uniref:helix-turn-helix domain-containing protein n=1 Tax=Streptomyces sp. CBMA123 TaxID=1896313 RepID=UPI0016620A64|nr:helix-turn-helix domain-containing protein [Streptomyces sp. CBMA123]MBD0694905.1 hypothetical protein [Streptomyces sp. CBMA123]